MMGQPLQDLNFFLMFSLSLHFSTKLQSAQLSYLSNNTNKHNGQQ